MDSFAVLLDSPGSPKNRLQIAALGDYTDRRYGKFSITRDDVDSWKTNLAHLPGKRALIDLDHSADRSPRSTEAAGWITGIDWDGETPVADVEWTPVGKQAIEDKRYLFFSPTYGDHKNERGDVHKNTLVGGALTNKPFLSGMPMLTLASAERVTEAVDDELERLIELKELDVSAKERKQAVADGNALPDESYPIRNAAELHSAAVLAASGHGDVAGARKLIRKRAAELGVSLSHLPGFKAPATADSPRSMEATTLIKALGLDADAGDAKILEAITTLQKPAEENEQVRTLEQERDALGQRVNTLEADNRAIRDEFQTLQSERANERFEQTFGKALSELRAVPAQRDDFRKLYEASPDLTLKMLDDAPRLLNAKPIGAEGDLQEPKTLDDRIKAIVTEKGVTYDKAYLIALDEMPEGGNA